MRPPITIGDNYDGPAYSKDLTRLVRLHWASRTARIVLVLTIGWLRRAMALVAMRCSASSAFKPLELGREPI
jgi:hypothetical protein